MTNDTVETTYQVKVTTSERGYLFPDTQLEIWSNEHGIIEKQILRYIPTGIGFDEIVYDPARGAMVDHIQRDPYSGEVTTRAEKPGACDKSGNLIMVDSKEHRLEEGKIVPIRPPSARSILTPTASLNSQ